MAFKTTKDGRPILRLTDMRAGHWPLIKSPPWGMTELSQSDLVKQFNLTVDTKLNLLAAMEDKQCGLIPVRLRQRVTASGQVSIFAHPTEERWWSYVPDPDD
jgi:hypothetical protein